MHSLAQFVLPSFVIVSFRDRTTVRPNRNRVRALGGFVKRHHDMLGGGPLAPPIYGGRRMCLFVGNAEAQNRRGVDLFPRSHAGVKHGSVLSETDLISVARSSKFVSSRRRRDRVARHDERVFSPLVIPNPASFDHKTEPFVEADRPRVLSPHLEAYLE